MNTYRQPGEVLTFTASANIASGDPVAFGIKQLGLATGAVASGAEGELHLAGVHALTKTAGTAAVAGAPAYWNPTTEAVVMAAAVGCYFIGHFAAAAGTTATACEVKLAESFREEGPRLLTAAAAADTTLTAADFLSGHLTLLVPNTDTVTVNLPAVASVPIGAMLRVKKTTADADAVTLDGNASETVGGGATFATIDANGDTALFANTGAAWVLLDSAIAS